MNIQIDEYKGYDILFETQGMFSIEKSGVFIDGNFDNTEECRETIDQLEEH